MRQSPRFASKVIVTPKVGFLPQKSLSFHSLITVCQPQFRRLCGLEVEFSAGGVYRDCPSLSNAPALTQLSAILTRRTHTFNVTAESGVIEPAWTHA